MKLRITPEIRSLIRKSLAEDLGRGDVTTQALIPANQQGEAEIVAKESGILCGGGVAREVFLLRDSRLRVTLHVQDGQRIRVGARPAVPLLTIRGRVQSILEAERVALNFLGRLSGIATSTRRFVEKVHGTRAKIFDTRKTTPLWRQLEKYAVRCGGGENHRFGLWDEILVKENHWRAMQPFLERTRCRYLVDRLVGAGLVPAFRGHPQGVPLQQRRKIPIEVEMRNLRELTHLLEGTFVPDRILLDNFSIRELKRAVLFVEGLNQILRTRYRIRRKRPLLEASGRVHLGNVRQIAQTGVDRISVGSLTHSAPALDFSLALIRSLGPGKI